MRQGKVKWYNGKKCFGFISPDTPNADGNTDDVFVHSSSLKAAGIRFLNENDIVEFEEEVRNGKLFNVTKNLPVVFGNVVPNAAARSKIANNAKKNQHVAVLHFGKNKFL